MKKLKDLLSTLAVTMLLIASGIAQVPLKTEKEPCIPCEELKNLSIPEVIITETETIKDGVHYCKIRGLIGKEINFELQLPDRWNSRYIMQGNGGFAGSIHVNPDFAKKGYASSGTDTGHKGNGLKADWALNNMERQLNFGHMAVHRTSVISREIIRQYYGSDSEFSYFIGCSRGGGQAMMEAQRYPEDFDGIVCGAPAFNWPAIGAEFIQNSRACYPDASKINESVISRANLELLQNLVLDQCDAVDGITDRILNDPRDCDFNFDLLPICPENTEGDDCFTPVQIEAIKLIYAGVSNQKGPIYPGFPLGGENENGGWFHWIVGPAPATLELNFPSAQFGFGTEMFKYLIYHDPDWDYQDHDFSNFFEDTRFASSFLDATSTDYSDFKALGGKMIIFHGWNDPALSAFSTIEHYEAAKQEDSNLEDCVRLFLLPGVLHCGGGPGPQQVDWLELIQDWVEKGNAPERVLVSKKMDGKVVMTRPILPFPRKSIYDGSGDPMLESSFIEEKE